MIENVIAGLKMDSETAEQKKKQVGNIVMHLELEILDNKYSGKDLTRIKRSYKKLVEHIGKANGKKNNKVTLLL